MLVSWLLHARPLPELEPNRFFAEKLDTLFRLLGAARHESISADLDHGPTTPSKVASADFTLPDFYLLFDKF